MTLILPGPRVTRTTARLGLPQGRPPTPPVIKTTRLGNSPMVRPPSPREIAVAAFIARNAHPDDNEDDVVSRIEQALPAYTPALAMKALRLASAATRQGKRRRARSADE